MLESPKRRSLVLASLAAAAAGPAILTRRAHAQAWPSRPIRFVVSFPPGGLTDLYARAYGEYIGQHIGQPVIVENRAGGSGLIGCDYVAKSAPDGHTILFTIASPIVQAQVLYKKLPYDPNRDFTFISAMPSGPLPFAVHRDLPAKNAKEYVELARSKSLNMGSFVQGSIPQMVAQQMNKLYGTRIEVVQYKGEAPMWQDVIASRIDSGIGSFTATGPHIKAGTIRASVSRGRADLDQHRARAGDHARLTNTLRCCSLSRARELQPDDARHDHRDTRQAERRPRLMEEHDAKHDGARRSNSGPDRIGSSDRNGLHCNAK